MPGLFGYYGKTNRDYLASKIKKLLSHDEDWFDGSILYHQNGFHGFSDFKYNLKKDLNSQDDKSIVVFGNIYSFNDQKLNSNKSKAILSYYEKNGLNFLKKLNGSFIISILDNDKLIVANDRLGSKNLFFQINSNELFYSSEIKGILAENSIKPTLNYEAVVELFTFSYLLGNKTYFNEIEILHPASMIIVDRNRIEIKQYFNYTYNRKYNENADLFNLLKEFSKIMQKSLKNRMKDKKKIGILLSGGLDSRLIACFAKKIAIKEGKELKSFTYGTRGGWQEKIAKKVSRKLKIENIFYEIPSDFIASYAEEIVYKGDGNIRIRDAHLFSYLRDIRTHVDLVLAGFICSELFGETLQDNILKILSKKELINYIYNNNDISKISRHIPFVFSKNFLKDTKNKVKENFISSINEIPSNSLIEISHHWEIQQKIRRYDIALANYCNWYLETRLPFIDNEIIDFALNLPIHLRFRKSFIHKALKYLFPALAIIPWEKTGAPVDTSGLILRLLIDKRVYTEKIKRIIEKISLNHILFRSPEYRAYNYFLRTGSKKYIVNMLLRELKGEIWNQEYTRKLLKEHLEKKNDNHYILCDILQIELIENLFL